MVKATAKAPEVIERGKSYPLKEFLRITKLGTQGLRDARDQGLRVVYLGRTAFVNGDDFIDFIADPARNTQRW